MIASVCEAQSDGTHDAGGKRPGDTPSSAPKAAILHRSAAEWSTWHDRGSLQGIAVCRPPFPQHDYRAVHLGRPPQST